jgi:chromosome transmission fidelity protein 18
MGAFLDADSDDEVDMTAAAESQLSDKSTAATSFTCEPHSKPESATVGIPDDDDFLDIDDPVSAQLHTETQQTFRNPLAFSSEPPRPLFKPVKTCSGQTVHIPFRKKTAAKTFEAQVAERSKTKEGRAKKSYYGIDVHHLVSEAKKKIAAEEKERAKAAAAAITPELPLPSVEVGANGRRRRTHMWTEKYRARRFGDLVGDDRTHRDVIRWLKTWDKIVFPHKARAVRKRPMRDGADEEEVTHKKILMLTGPPGLGKTTLAHVCAAQAGYEVLEINASDDRSANVVRGRIRTAVGTETVKKVTGVGLDPMSTKGPRPACVVVDEVDGVVSGSGGSGEGGFIKALIDLVNLDAKNAAGGPRSKSGSHGSRKKKEDDFFRLMRPMILICNDVYHPSLRPLRQSGYAETIHIRKPPIEKVVQRMQAVFQKEGVTADSDAVRKLCEATWGVDTSPEARFKESSGQGEGDLRSVLVTGEWVARKLKVECSSSRKPGMKPHLTKKWVEANLLSLGGAANRGLGRGGSKDLVSRIFMAGAGFPKPPADPQRMEGSSKIDAPKTQLHAVELVKKHGIERLREMVDTSDEHDRIVNDVFALYPTQPWHDDNILSKPDAAYEWLHFYGSASKGVYREQSWELAPYLSQPILAMHDLFASPARHFNTNADSDFKRKNADDEEVEKEIPFSGPRADYDASEATKASHALLTSLQDQLRDPSMIFKEQNARLLRSFRSPEAMATDLIPYLVRILSPDVKPVVVGGSGDSKGVASVRREAEREMVKRAAGVMAAVGVQYLRGRLEDAAPASSSFQSRAQAQWVYRMEPPLDTLCEFETAGSSTGASAIPIRYAVRQVLDQEHQRIQAALVTLARQHRFQSGNALGDDAVFDFATGKAASVARDARPVNIEEELSKVKRDFFGRVVVEKRAPLEEIGGNASKKARREGSEGAGKEGHGKVWVTFHEGFSNAVRKPVTLRELLRGL